MGNTKSKMLKGMFWITIDKYSGLALSILISMVLARLLTPDEFGLVTLASVLLTFIGLLSNMGLSPAIIQEQNLTQKDINSLFTFTIIVGLILSCLYFCLSWPIARFYNNDQLVPVCQLLSISLFFGVINNVPGSLMTKNQCFKDYFCVESSPATKFCPISERHGYDGNTIPQSYLRLGRNQFSNRYHLVYVWTGNYPLHVWPSMGTGHPLFPDSLPVVAMRYANKYDWIHFPSQ